MRRYPVASCGGSGGMGGECFQGSQPPDEIARLRFRLQALEEEFALRSEGQLVRKELESMATVHALLERRLGQVELQVFNGADGEALGREAAGVLGPGELEALARHMGDEVRGRLDADVQQLHRESEERRHEQVTVMAELIRLQGRVTHCTELAEKANKNAAGWDITLESLKSFVDGIVPAVASIRHQKARVEELSAEIAAVRADAAAHASERDVAELRAGQQHLANKCTNFEGALGMLAEQLSTSLRAGAGLAAAAVAAASPVGSPRRMRDSSEFRSLSPIASASSGREFAGELSDSVSPRHRVLAVPPDVALARLGALAGRGSVPCVQQGVASRSSCRLHADCQAGVDRLDSAPPSRSRSAVGSASSSLGCTSSSFGRMGGSCTFEERARSARAERLERSGDSAGEAVMVAESLSAALDDVLRWRKGSR